MGKTRNTGFSNNAIQYNSGSIAFVSGSTTLLNISSSGNIVTTGTITAQTLVIQTVTSSVSFVTGSTKFGSIIGNTHQFTGSLNASGSSHSIYGVLGLGTTTLSTEANLYLGAQGTDEGGQLIFQKGTSYTSASHIDNYQNRLRIMRGNDTSSTAELMTINMNTGNVGIGTSNPLTILHLNSPAATNATIYFGVNGTGNGYLGQAASAGSLSSGAAVGDIVLRSQTNLLFTSGGDTERMRITSGGVLLVGGITSTSAYLDGYVSVAVPSGTAPAACFKNLDAAQFVASFWNNASSGDNIFVRFVSDPGASIRGTIFYSRSNGVARFDGQASGTYSDERLKDIKGEMTYGLDTINKIKTYDFNWKRNGNKGFGVKAQEIHELIPEVVEKGNNGEIDPMEFQTTDIWKVNYNELVPVLVKAIQELKAENDALKTRIETLENK